MKMTSIKRLLIGFGATFLALLLILGIHIYMVTRPKAPDAHTIVMVRIDLNQQITAADASGITTWFYQQPGISHVLCNAAMGNIVFTFYPVKTDGSKIVDKFRSDLNYLKATRYIPTDKELQSGCPVATTSFSYRMYSFFKRVF